MWTNLIAFKEMVQRMFFWGWKMRHNYDFEASYMYEVIYLKLDRVHTCFLENGHCMWNDGADTKGMKRLSETRNLAKRLSEDDYSTHMGPHYAAYPFENIDLLTKMGEKERVSFRRAHRKDQAQRAAEKKRFFKLLEGNVDGWWD